MEAFAIIPAAGRSQRMGRPKLLLPWGSSTVIEHVLAAWRESRVDRIVIVVHPEDQELARLARASGAEVVVPQAPPADMKTSIRLGLDHLSPASPAADDAWLVAPADMPGLTSAVIDRVCDAYEASLARSEAPRIWVASHAGRRGHPLLCPWSFAHEVGQLAADQGLNALVAKHTVELVETTAGAIFEDLDTPEDYARLKARHQAQDPS